MSYTKVLITTHLGQLEKLFLLHLFSDIINYIVLEARVSRRHFYQAGLSDLGCPMTGLVSERSRSVLFVIFLVTVSIHFKRNPLADSMTYFIYLCGTQLSQK